MEFLNTINYYAAYNTSEECSVWIESILVTDITCYNGALYLRARA